MAEVQGGTREENGANEVRSADIIESGWNCFILSGGGKEARSLIATISDIRSGASKAKEGRAEVVAIGIVATGAKERERLEKRSYINL